MLVWETQQQTRKPILVDFLSNMNMESYWEKVSFSSIRTNSASFIDETIHILHQHELARTECSSLRRKQLVEESCAVIDFLLTAIYTQPLLASILLKPDSLDRVKNKRSTDLQIRIRKFFEADEHLRDPRLCNKYLNLIVEIFAREQVYQSFCMDFR